jgi:hypothetical protein
MIVEVLPVGVDRRFFQPSADAVVDPSFASFLEGDRIAGGDVGAFGDFAARTNEPLVGIPPPAELLVATFAFKSL